MAHKREFMRTNFLDTMCACVYIYTNRRLKEKTMFGSTFAHLAKKLLTLVHNCACVGL